MLKKSTLLFIGTFFLLFIGLSDYGYGCHKPGKNDNKGCNDPPQGGEEGLYSVTIHMVSPVGGGLEGASNPDEPWGEGNRHLIGQNSVHQPDRVGELTNLDFLVQRFPGGTDDNCFGGLVPIQLQESMVKRGRGGRAESTLRFFAWTEEGTSNGYMPLYQLNLFGDTVPSEEWFPSDFVDLRMTDWKLQLEAEGQGVKNISCLGEFDEDNDDPFEVWITVTRTNEE